MRSINARVSQLERATENVNALEEMEEIRKNPRGTGKSLNTWPSCLRTLSRTQEY